MVDWEEGDDSNNKNVKKRSNIWRKFVELNCGYRIVVYFVKVFL